MTEPKRLAGRVALVTGASRGIGKGIAVELASAGAKVYFTGRSTTEEPQRPGTIGRTADEIARAGGAAVALRCDHHRDDEVAGVFARIEKDEGRLDLLVNNATADLASMVGRRFWELPLAMWDDVIGVGLRSHYVATWHAARLMLPRRRGLIVNVSSHGSREYLMGVTQKTMPSWLGWVGAIAGTFVVLTLFAPGTPLSNLAGALFMPALLLSCLARWRGNRLDRSHPQGVLAEPRAIIPREAAEVLVAAVARGLGDLAALETIAPTAAIARIDCPWTEGAAPDRAGLELRPVLADAMDHQTITACSESPSWIRSLRNSRRPA